MYPASFIYACSYGNHLDFLILHILITLSMKSLVHRIILLLSLWYMPGLAKAQAPDLSFGLANKHTYFVNYAASEQNWVNYYQLSYAHPLNKHFSLTGHLSFAQDAGEEPYIGLGMFGEPRHEANDIFSMTTLDLAVRWSLINLSRHQFSIFLGPSLKRQAIMSAVEKSTGRISSSQPLGYEPTTIHRLQERQERESYEVGTDSRWIGALYLAAEYVFYPLPQLGVGYTFRVRSQPWFFWEDASLGPVIRYRWADQTTSSQSGDRDEAFALHILPTRVGSAERTATQIRSSYRRQLDKHWSLGGNISYVQGSHFPVTHLDFETEYYQYHATLFSLTAGYQLFQTKRHRMQLQAGPAFNWSAQAMPEFFLNAVDIETETIYYDPEITEEDNKYIGDLLMVEVELKQRWGIDAGLQYTYQLNSSLGLSGIANYQHYADGESLFGVGVGIELLF